MFTGNKTVLVDHDCTENIQPVKHDLGAQNWSMGQAEVGAS